MRAPIIALTAFAAVILLSFTALFATPDACAAGPAASGRAAACDPQIAQQLQAAAHQGATNAIALVRHPQTGVRQPDSIFDFSCIEDLLRTPDINILFDPNRIINGILRAIQDAVCEAAEGLYAEHIGRPLDDLIFDRDIPRLPGLDIDIRKSRTPEYPNVRVQPIERPSANKGHRTDAEIFRKMLGGN